MQDFREEYTALLRSGLLNIHVRNVYLEAININPAFFASFAESIMCWQWECRSTICIPNAQIKIFLFRGPISHLMIL